MFHEAFFYLSNLAKMSATITRLSTARSTCWLCSKSANIFRLSSIASPRISFSTTCKTRHITQWHHSPFHNEDQYLFRTPIFHTSPAHLISLNYHVFRLKNSNPKRSFPAMKSLLVFDHPCFSSPNLLDLPNPFEDWGIRIVHKT